jgi:uncharacterized protein YacL
MDYILAMFCKTLCISVNTIAYQTRKLARASLFDRDHVLVKLCSKVHLQMSTNLEVLIADIAVEPMVLIGLVLGTLVSGLDLLRIGRRPFLVAKLLQLVVISLAFEALGLQLLSSESKSPIGVSPNGL